MTLPSHKTKIVCTIGPASASLETLTQMIRAGMNVCRLNFAHGDFESHGESIRLIRDAARAENTRVAILADLPGPKMRMGEIAGGQVTLDNGATVVLSSGPRDNRDNHLPIQFSELPRLVKTGDTIFLNDGFLHLTVEEVGESDIRCRVDVGGVLMSHKGINVPGQELGISAFTDRDRELLNFAVGQGVDAVSVSFVQRPEDIEEVRAAAKAAGGNPFIVAKIERAIAVDRIDDILRVVDGIMVARGDLGVETPIESIAIVQKRLIESANHARIPVITATQMLESMVDNPRPTRAESTDVANAILDGTDCVMLSEESAMGQYPVDAVRMLASIAHATESDRETRIHRTALPFTARAFHGVLHDDPEQVIDVIALDVAAAVTRLHARLVIAPTNSGKISRLISAFRLPRWIVAFSPNPDTCQRLCFCYGVYPVALNGDVQNWVKAAGTWIRDNGLLEGVAVVTHRWHDGRHEGTNRMEIVDLETYFTE